MVTSICCCVIASWAVQAQEATRRADTWPNGTGISMNEGAAGLLSGPPIGSASSTTGGSLRFSDQFTLGGTQNSVTLDNFRSSSISVGGNSSANKSCLTVRAYTRPDFANKNLHQNWLNAKNGCGQHIKVSVCYRGSASCISISVPPWQAKSAIIGYAPTATPMHYQIKLEN